MSSEYMSAFDNCVTLTDIYAVARELRKNADISNQEINALVGAAKKQVMKKSMDYRRIEKQAIPVVAHSDVPISQYALSIEHITDPSISINDAGVVTL